MFPISKPTYKEWVNASPNDVINIAIPNWNPHEHHQEHIDVTPPLCHTNSMAHDVDDGTHLSPLLQTGDLDTTEYDDTNDHDNSFQCSRISQAYHWETDHYGDVIEYNKDIMDYINVPDVISHTLQ